MVGGVEENSNQPLTRYLLLANAMPRCGAKTRSGRPCQGAAVSGRQRCRMHGGAKGSGAPAGERNGRYIHGRFTLEAKQDRMEVKELIRFFRDSEEI